VRKKTAASRSATKNQRDDHLHPFSNTPTSYSMPTDKPSLDFSHSSLAKLNVDAMTLFEVAARMKRSIPEGVDEILPFLPNSGFFHLSVGRSLTSRLATSQRRTILTKGLGSRRASVLSLVERRSPASDRAFPYFLPPLPHVRFPTTFRRSYI
jgi:hypothetical protein